LRYISRAVASAKFGAFVEKDADAVIALFDFFQEGTHGIGVTLAQENLVALVTRVECAIQFLLGLDAENR
jgi:hypothetical protein